eukprot:TRINITY_DN63456_c0_g1_i1.p2 TRINITY_DN63456_c0_g1~~TRINITY_DN63456_c0_g1_i1.p2  ORF type:complete len:106 (-),score=21.25 TRINITY_DN63456_c0_g1_i1:48-365(-)
MSVSMVGEGRALFRAIMRLHREKLADPRMRSLGDAYVRREFKLHFAPDVKESHRGMFFKEWRSYVQTIGGQATVRGQELSDDQRGKLNNDQKKQLADLEKSTKQL